MLLHSTTCQQPWRTSTILCHQRHRQGSGILESKTGPQTRTASGTMALGYELDTQPSTTSHHPRPHDQAVQYYTPDSFYWHCIYQISFGYGQPLQSQRGSQSVGRRRDPNLCVPSSPTTFTFTSPSRSTPRYRWRCTTIRRCTIHIYCHRLTSKQDLPTIQGDLQLPLFRSDDMDYKEFTPITTSRTPR